jgi:hypothetical protein
MKLVLLILSSLRHIALNMRCINKEEGRFYCLGGVTKLIYSRQELCAAVIVLIGIGMHFGIIYLQWHHERVGFTALET